MSFHRHSRPTIFHEIRMGCCPHGCCGCMLAVLMPIAFIAAVIAVILVVAL